MDIQHKRRVAERAAKELNAVFHIGASDADLLGNLGNVSRDVEADYLSRQATDTIPKVSKLGQSRPGHHSDKASPYGHGHSHGRNAKRAMSRRLPVLPVLPVQGQKLWEAPVSQYETFARSPTRRTFEEEQSLRNRTSHPHRSLDVMLVGQGISNWTTQGPKELEEPWHETYEDATLHENAGIESFPEGRDTPSPMQLAPLVVHDTAYQTDRGSNGNPIEEHARFQSFSDIEAVFKKYSALLGRESEGFGGAMEGSSLASLPRALGAADENADRRASVTVVTT
ncbi:uncharacterized protein EV422DRAFT_366866 [Fimicolochytrium jonesii]|uniref:uncharacterized protein n=1 Tax=Fimicolochytrium jonesii TaxID=1396493 RepID=UPI0022FEE38C|nr:uncharacterized protein EV422DRAFT_366866 [Fimicolochytrium jonesii]KAI8823701.1 hypothetical protein EV422DRAFT_366866 [Fimicolochytrium jonesii]